MPSFSNISAAIIYSCVNLNVLYSVFLKLSLTADMVFPNIKWNQHEIQTDQL